MPDSMNRTTEAELSNIVLEILAARKDGTRTFSQLIEEIPSLISLTQEDLVQSDTRPAEGVWEQRVRNIKSHKSAEGNFIAEGYLVEVPNGLSITSAGRARAARAS